MFPSPTAFPPSPPSPPRQYVIITQTWLHPLELNTQPPLTFALSPALADCPTNLLGTRVPNFGAPFGMVMVEGCWEPGLEEWDDFMLPLEGVFTKGVFRLYQNIIQNVISFFVITLLKKKLQNLNFPV